MGCLFGRPTKQNTYGYKDENLQKYKPFLSPDWIYDNPWANETSGQIPQPYASQQQPYVPQQQYIPQQQQYIPQQQQYVTQQYIPPQYTTSQ